MTKQFDRASKMDAALNEVRGLEMVAEDPAPDVALPDHPDAAALDQLMLVRLSAMEQHPAPTSLTWLEAFRLGYETAVHDLRNLRPETNVQLIAPRLRIAGSGTDASMARVLSGVSGISQEFENHSQNETALPCINCGSKKPTHYCQIQNGH